MTVFKKYGWISAVVLIGLVVVFDIIHPAKLPPGVEKAWITIVLAAIAAAISIYSAIDANSKEKKLAKQMENAKLNKPAGLTNAERTLSALASQGLPGKDIIEDALKEPLAQSLTNMRELGASPVTIAGMANQGMSEVTGNIRQLMVADEQAKMGNMVALANFQAGPLAGFDLQQQEFNINKELGASYARMEGSAQLYQGIANAVGSMGNAYGQEEYLNYLKGLNAGGKAVNTTGLNQNTQATYAQWQAAQFQYDLDQAMNGFKKFGSSNNSNTLGNWGQASYGTPVNDNSLAGGIY